MDKEFASSENHEAHIAANTHVEGGFPVDAMPINRYALLTEPANYHYLELLQGFIQHLEHWHTVVSSPEYLVEYTKDEKEETWRRGFDIVQSDANPQIIPLTKEREEQLEGGVVRVSSNSMVSSTYFPSANFSIAVENLYQQDSMLTDPYNNQSLIEFYKMVHRSNYSPGNNLTQEKHEFRFASQTYDTHTHRFRDYSATYILKGNRLSVKKHARTKFLSADHSKALLSLVDSLMP